MDLVGEERGRLARVAGWLDASPAEAAGLVVLLVGALVVTATLVWGALGRPSLVEGGAAPDAASVPGGSSVDDVEAVGSDPSDGAGAHGAGAHGSGAHGAGAHGAGAGVDGSPPAEGGAASHEHAEAAPATEVTVHVAGAVGRPGVVTLPAGDRVADAIERAGGLAPDADPARINLARPLTDGEQIVVLREGEEPPAPLPGPPTDGPPASGDGAAPTDPGGGPVDVNTAGTAELETLPGIGPALAQRIVTHREQHGPFRQPGDLRDVSGIGDKRFQDIADLITVG